jgi:uncharacterized protein (TIGR02001 family)
MSPNKLSLVLGVLLLGSPMITLAQDAGATADPAQAEPAVEPPAKAEPNLTWNLSVTSDYVFRGITQTDFKPALQGGLDYAFGDSGFYVGAWGSNVDFADRDGPDLEVDSYVGYNTDVNDSVNLDFSVVRYSYLGERDVYGNIDFNEFLGKVTYDEMVTFTVAYADNYSNLDYSSLYFNLAGEWEIGNQLSLNAGIGHTDFSDNNGSYSDWNVGLSRQFGPVKAALNYYDTNVSGGKTSDTLVLSLALGN